MPTLFNWRHFFQLTLMGKLFLFIGITFCVAALLLSAQFTYQGVARERDQIKENIDFLANNIGTVGADLILNKDLGALEQVLLVNAKIPYVKSILIVDTKDRVLAAVANINGLPKTQFSEKATFHSGTEAAIDSMMGKTYAETWIENLLPSDHELENWYPIQTGSTLAAIRIRYSLADLRNRIMTQWMQSVALAIAVALLSLAILAALLRFPLQVLQSTTTFASRLNRHIGEKITLYPGTFYELGKALNDLSEQLKIQELTLYEKIEHTRSILDNAIDGIITIDALGTIRSFNPAACKMFGYTVDEVMSKNVRMLMAEPIRGQHDDYLKNYAEGGAPKILGIGREVEALRKNGQTFPMDLAISRALDYSEVIYIGIVRDISERRHLDKLKSEFVSTVSHELRTPLTSIHGSLKLLEGGVVGDLPEAAKKLVRLAQKNSQRLILLINDLLDMEKFAAGKMVLELQPTDLVSIVKQSILDNGGYGLTYDVQYVLGVHPEQIFVLADAARLQQILANLLSNAAKFSGESHQVDVRIIQRGERARVEIEDYGPGISSEFQSHIFGAFSQEHNNNTRKQGGTGLGLKISKSLVLAMQGEIGFDTNIGQGTVFWFELKDHIPPLTEPNG